MKRLILSLLLITYSIASWCQYPDKHIQDLQQVARVTLPDSPVVRHTKRGLVYTVSYDGLIYTASGAVIKQGLGDIIQSDPLDSIYVSAINGIVRTTNGKLLYKKDITEQGLKGMEFETSSVDSLAKYNLFYRIFYFNDKLVIQGIWCPQDVQRTDDRINTFFNTFKLTIKPGDIRQGTSVIIFSAVKYALIIVLALAVIVALIVFLARRSNSKQSS
ncbi:MAG TPA: hypothetical protein VHS53_13730 [Mucilaginibacter sp.]|nr:hypothetical protein [Mucilaginibacter sp.]